MPEDRKPLTGDEDLTESARRLSEALDQPDAKPDPPPFDPSPNPMRDERIRSTIGDGGGLRVSMGWQDFGDDTPIGGIGRKVVGFRRQRFGFGSPPLKGGVFNDDDGCARGCFYPLGCLGAFLLVLLILIVAAIFVLDGGGDDADTNLVTGGGTEVTSSPAPSSSPAADASAVPTDVPTEIPTEAPLERTILQIGNAVIDEIWWELYVTTGVPGFVIDEIADGLADFIDSISRLNPAYTSPYFDIRRSNAVRLRFTAPGIHEAYGQTIYECGDRTDLRTVVCPDDVQAMPADGGDVWMFSMSMDGEVPQASPDRSFIYSIVFDSDGEAANDWVFFPPFDFDLFRDSDRWYQLAWDHSSQQWFLSVTQIDGNQVQGPFASAVRAVIQGDTIVFFIPASEFQLEQPPYRMTAFGHDGSFSENDRGADVTGGDPTEALTVPPSEVLNAMPEDRAAE